MAKKKKQELNGENFNLRFGVFCLAFEILQDWFETVKITVADLSARLSIQLCYNFG